MEAEHFVQTIQRLFDQHELNEDKGFLKRILTFRPKEIKTDLTGDFLADLYNMYEVVGRTIVFNFAKELTTIEGCTFFAFQDPFEVGIELKTANIIMWDPEHEALVYRLAPNINSFLKVLLLIYEYGLPGWFEEKQYSRIERNQLYEKIKQILNSEFLSYYKESYED